MEKINSKRKNNRYILEIHTYVILLHYIMYLVVMLIINLLITVLNFEDKTVGICYLERFHCIFYQYNTKKKKKYKIHVFDTIIQNNNEKQERNLEKCKKKFDRSRRRCFRQSKRPATVPCTL